MGAGESEALDALSLSKSFLNFSIINFFGSDKKKKPLLYFRVKETVFPGEVGKAKHAVCLTGRYLREKNNNKRKQSI